MGQKVNPHGMRVGVIKDWDSRWYASDEKVGDLIVEDYKIRKYLKKTAVCRRYPEDRDRARAAQGRHHLYPLRSSRRWSSARAASRSSSIRLYVEKMIGKPVVLNIVEVRTRIRTHSSSPRTSLRSSRSVSASAAR